MRDRLGLGRRFHKHRQCDGTVSLRVGNISKGDPSARGGRTDTGQQHLLPCPGGLYNALQSAQLHQADSRRHLRHPEVGAPQYLNVRYLQPVPGGHVVIHEGPLPDLLVTGRHHAALTRRDDLAELQAEAADVTNGAEPATLEAGSVSLGTVFDNPEPVTLCDVKNGIHSRHRPAHMHRHDRLGVRAYLPLNIGRVERQ